MGKERERERERERYDTAVSVIDALMSGLNGPAAHRRRHFNEREDFSAPYCGLRKVNHSESVRRNRKVTYPVPIVGRHVEHCLSNNFGSHLII